MQSSFSAQLIRLGLDGFQVERAPVSNVPPDRDAADHVMAAIWSDLFSLFPDTCVEEDAEQIAWGVVNIFHRAALKRAGQVDRATDEIRLLLASADGSEVRTYELEEQIDRARAAETAMITLEAMREIAARLYNDETGHSWRPATGSRANHGASLTSAMVDGRDFLKARAESRRRALMPEGTPVVFAGGRPASASEAEAKALATSVWDTLDKVRGRVGDMVLVHGGDTKGLDQLAASWAERRAVPQIGLGLDRRLGQRAGFRRNEQMLALKPRYVVAFPGNGVHERLVIQAKELKITVVDRRGHAGRHPKAADQAASSPGG